MKRSITIIVVLFVLAGGGYYAYRSWAASRQPAPEFKTATITRGELLATISATGTIEPEEVIDVGAQVAGQILFFGKDSKGKSIDYGSQVEEGTILAQIDDSVYQADVAQNQAAVAQAQAQIEQAHASISRAEADLKQLQAKA